MNKARIPALVLALITAFAVAGCTEQNAGGQTVVVTTDALYEIVSAVAGDRIEVINLLSGEEIHHFEPTAKDAETLSNASLIIYNGLGLDDWARELSGDAKAFSVTTDSSMPGLIDGDPHVWLSPACAVMMANAICDKLKEFDPSGQNIYDENFGAFREELQSLSDEFKPKFANARLDTFVTGHAALAYLAAEFGLTQKSVSDIFSTGEPTARQLMALADFCNENGVKFILSESNAPLAVSETLANDCSAEILSVYMMESADGDGLSFIERTRHNLEMVFKAVT